MFPISALQNSKQDASFDKSEEETLQCTWASRNYEMRKLKHLKVIEKVSEIFTLSLKNKDLQGKKGKKNLQYHNILFGKHIFYKHNTCPLLKIWKLYECTENQIISPSSFFPEISATSNFVHWFSIYHLSLQWNITSCLLSHTSII